MGDRDNLAAPGRAAAYSIALHPQHQKMLAESGISPGFAAQRHYLTADTKRQLEGYGIALAGRNVPGLVIPLLDADGQTWGYQYRPDEPRERDGKVVKYETPVGQRPRIDVPPGVGPVLDDPGCPLYITEGTRKADAAAQRGLACIALMGVWAWTGTNEHGGNTALADWRDIALNERTVVLAFDSDVMRKPSVQQALTELAGYLGNKGAKVTYLHLPDDGTAKVGLDDFLVRHDVADLAALIRDRPPELTDTSARTGAPTAVTEPMSLPDAHKVFQRWLGDSFDLDALDIVLAAAAVERIHGDPVWIIIVGAPGSGKTEIISSLAGAGAVVTSTISSEGALLSGTANKERTKDATGGLLRRLGACGTLAIKDFSSILEMNRTLRPAVIAALREVYDGHWVRNVGIDGGRSLEWSGRITLIAGGTTAWDGAHSVIQAMGDRFAVVRLDSRDSQTRLRAGMQAMANIGNEVVMREELAAATGGVLAALNIEDAHVELTDEALLLRAANLVTFARTAVERDHRGDVSDVHAPEMPTRFAKQLGQLVRGARAIGLPRPKALALALRVARQSIPPIRLAALMQVAEFPCTSARAAARRLGRPERTMARALEDLAMIGLVLDETDTSNAHRYTLAPGVDLLALLGSPEMSPHQQEEGGEG